MVGVARGPSPPQCLEESRWSFIGPHLFARLAFVANDRFELASLLLGYQVFASDCKRAPGWSKRNAPEFFWRIGFPIRREALSVLNPILQRPTKTGPLWLKKHIPRSFYLGCGRIGWSIFATGKKFLFGRFVPSPVQPECKIPPNAVCLGQSRHPSSDQCKN